jgi:hypothetical protein
VRGEVGRRKRPERLFGGEILTFIEELELIGELGHLHLELVVLLLLDPVETYLLRVYLRDLLVLAVVFV